MKDFKIDGNIDWKQLRGQKLFLLKHNDDEATGLINFIDNVQDSAVKSRLFSEKEVFDLAQEIQRGDVENVAKILNIVLTAKQITEVLNLYPVYSEDSDDNWRTIVEQIIDDEEF